MNAAPGAPSTEGIGCGLTPGGTVRETCMGTEMCCVVEPGNDFCGDTCTCPAPGCAILEVTCDGPEDCGSGDVCCGIFDPSAGTGGAYTSVGCQATCDSTNNEFTFCGRGGTCSGGGGLECLPSTILPVPNPAGSDLYYVCRMP